ncbi:MAG: hypothetical protein K8T91_27470 [Planctomycetes bacterium]|nr:hypothetical protein [Planctomycetota bacterium]
MSRPLRMLASLIVLWGIYWLYSLIIVPLVEPRAVAYVPKAVPPPGPTAPRPTKQTEILRRILGDAPELHDPIILETPNFTLLLKDYKTIAERQVEIKPCTLVFFPDGSGSESRVIVMRAPGGAILDFDEDCDLSRAKIGRLLGGRLVGEVTIQGNLARGEAAGDAAGDLRVSTRDVQLNQQRIWTPHDVNFQLGSNRGSGSDMQILLATPTTGNRKGRQAMPQGIESFQLLRDVRLTANIGGGGLLPGPKGAAAAAPQPLEVSCQGAFRFDMKDYVATFENQVDVKRMNPTGPADSLSCELLAIHFSRADAGPNLRALHPKKQALKAAGGMMPPPGEAAEANLANLRRANSFSVTTVEARGNPVIVHAVTPQGEGEARGEHLEYDVQTGGLLVEGDEAVTLRFGPQQIISKLIRYTPSPDGQSAEALAEGNGKFSGALPGDPTKRIEATWTRQLSLRPHDGKQLLSVLGNAKLNYADLGSLAGEEIWLWLVDTGGAPGGQQPQWANGDQLGGGATRSAGKYRPHSLLCRGKVEIDSPQFASHTEQLEVWFQPGGTNAAAGAAAEPGAAAPAFQPRPAGVAAGPRYELSGRLTRIQFVVGSGQPVLRDVSLSGDVMFSERPAPGVAERPLKLTGDEVQLLSADSAETTLSVAGKPARVEARGLGLSGANIRYDKAASRLWIDGQGEMTFLIPGGGVGGPAGGGPLALPATPAQPAGNKPSTPVAVQFAKGLNFDGRTARFDGPVVVRSAERQLQTPQLIVRLSEPIDLTQPKSNRQPQLEKIACIGGIVMENRTLDVSGQVTAIDRLQAADLTIEQPSGALSATGPGWASTIRAGNNAALPGPLAGRAPAAAPADVKSKLTYVRVRFAQGISGNVNRRELTFADQIACIYSPVADWAAEIEPPRASDLTADQLLLTCDKMTANDLGAAGAPPAIAGAKPDSAATIELQALGNARIDAQRFTAEGDRLIYSAGKQLLTLEGAGQADAHLWQKGPNGEATSHAAARKILYWRATNRVQVQDIRNIDLNQLGRSR